VTFFKRALKILVHALFIVGALSYNLWAPCAKICFPDFFYAFLFLAMRQNHLRVFVLYFVLSGIFRYHFWGQSSLMLACEGLCIYIAFEIEKLWFQKGMVGFLASFSVFQLLFFMLHGFPIQKVNFLHIIWIYLFCIFWFLFCEEDQKNDFF
jgi:hypothetical protein